MTPSADLLIRMMRSEAAHWDDVATTDAPMVMRQRAEARRDQLDWVVQQLQTALPAIEAEAVDAAMRWDAHLDAVLETVA